MVDRDLAASVLAGDRRGLARAITLLESRSDKDQPALDALLEALLPHAGQSVRVGVCGPPGVGKSTLIDALGALAIERGRRVAVLAVDPSSTRTGGSILGDKTRMSRLLDKAEAFIRPSPSGGQRGGVAPRTREAIIACEAGGHDLVLVETVGVGQAETGAADLVDCLLVLAAAGAGDELTGMKRGLIEHGDVFAVTKADGAEVSRAEVAARDLASALKLLSGDRAVLTISGRSGAGVLELWAELDGFAAAAHSSGAFSERRRAQARAWFDERVEQGLLERLRADPAVAALEADLGARAERGELSPRRAAAELLTRVSLGK
jgi:LAO/AO transport system kinase